ncbi:MAG: peptidyl-alpha-hydroxyglycine alpha-amidating lyase family protein [Bryobacteraceae bacterium]|nr:peptidyl-alpha-hydroxyglycine alpha-amidating lyase family protein [Bryobacteraceae bacterium]MDW8376675.1 peptidyl-alpha-hydroxyglycine alpha-amidating lyase family protein [Bryobacterales bacterium]
MRLFLLLPLVTFCSLGQIPQLPHTLVPDWPQLPKGFIFGEVSGVDVDRQDNVWVFHRGSHPVIQFDKNGRMLQAWKDLGVKSSHGLRIDPGGNVWLVDVAGHSLLKFSPSGRLLMVIASAGAAAGDNDSKYAYNRPTSLAFHPNGHFYVSDGYVNARVVRYTPEGEYVQHWGKKGAADGEFDLAHDITIDRRGRIYVADRSNHRVQIFDENGKFLGKWTHLGQPWGLYYVAKEDAIYLCDGWKNRVLKVNLDGQILGELGSFGKSPGKFDFAHHLSVDSEGSLYVAEIKNWRVQKFARKSR